MSCPESLVELTPVCRHKFASNVVEKALKHANDKDKRELISEMMGEGTDGSENRIQTLLRDQYGNFPVQTALAEAEKDQRDKLLSIIIPLMPNLRHTPCGRRLEGRINELESKGELPALSSASASSWESPDLLTGSETESTSVSPETPCPNAGAQVNGSAKPAPKSAAARRVASPNAKEEAQGMKDLLV